MNCESWAKPYGMSSDNFMVPTVGHDERTKDLPSPAMDCKTMIPKGYSTVRLRVMKNQMQFPNKGSNLVQYPLSTGNPAEVA